MKNKIFDKMMEYGWNLGGNEYRDFEKVCKWHLAFIDNTYNNLENKGKSINSIDEDDLKDMCSFMSDFLRALNEIDSETKTLTHEDKTLGTLVDLLNKD